MLELTRKLSLSAEIFMYKVFFLYFNPAALRPAVCVWKHSWSGDSEGFWSFKPGGNLMEKGSAHIISLAVLLPQCSFYFSIYFWMFFFLLFLIFFQTNIFTSIWRRAQLSFPWTLMHSTAFRLKRISASMTMNIIEPSVLRERASVEWAII